MTEQERNEEIKILRLHISVNTKLIGEMCDASKKLLMKVIDIEKRLAELEKNK